MGKEKLSFDGIRICNLRYADDTTASEKDLFNLVRRIKQRSKSADKQEEN